MLGKAGQWERLVGTSLTSNRWPKPRASSPSSSGPRSPKGNVFNFQIPPRAKENSSKIAINIERVSSDFGKHFVGFKMKYPVTNLM